MSGSPQDPPTADPVGDLIVVAAVIERDGCFLVTRRLEGTHLAGYWEFPGGKCDEAESLEDCLRRELREELGVEIDIDREIFRTRHRYPERTLELCFFACRLLGAPRPLLDQQMQWIERSLLRTLTFPPADDALIDRLLKK